VLPEQGTFCSGFFFSFSSGECVVKVWGNVFSSAPVVRLPTVDSIFLLCHTSVFSPSLCFPRLRQPYLISSFLLSTLTIHVLPMPGYLSFYRTNTRYPLCYPHASLSLPLQPHTLSRVHCCYSRTSQCRTKKSFLYIPPEVCGGGQLDYWWSSELF